MARERVTEGGNYGTFNPGRILWRVASIAGTAWVCAVAAGFGRGAAASPQEVRDCYNATKVLDDDPGLKDCVREATADAAPAQVGRYFYDSPWTNFSFPATNSTPPEVVPISLEDSVDAAYALAGVPAAQIPPLREQTIATKAWRESDPANTPITTGAAATGEGSTGGQPPANTTGTTAAGSSTGAGSSTTGDLTTALTTLFTSAAAITAAATTAGTTAGAATTATTLASTLASTLAATGASTATTAALTNLVTAAATGTTAAVITAASAALTTAGVTATTTQQVTTALTTALNTGNTTGLTAALTTAFASSGIPGETTAALTAALTTVTTELASTGQISASTAATLVTTLTAATTGNGVYSPSESGGYTTGQQVGIGFGIAVATLCVIGCCVAAVLYKCGQRNDKSAEDAELGASSSTSSSHTHDSDSSSDSDSGTPLGDGDGRSSGSGAAVADAVRAATARAVAAASLPPTTSSRRSVPESSISTPETSGANSDSEVSSHSNNSVYSSSDSAAARAAAEREAEREALNNVFSSTNAVVHSSAKPAAESTPQVPFTTKILQPFRDRAVDYVRRKVGTGTRAQREKADAIIAKVDDACKSVYEQAGNPAGLIAHFTSKGHIDNLIARMEREELYGKTTELNPDTGGAGIKSEQQRQQRQAQRRDNSLRRARLSSALGNAQLPAPLVPDAGASALIARAGAGTPDLRSGLSVAPSTHGSDDESSRSSSRSELDAETGGPGSHASRLDDADERAANLGMNR